MKAILKVLENPNLHAQYEHFGHDWFDYADALKALWPEIGELDGMEQVHDPGPDVAVKVLGCGSSALVLSVPGTTFALKFTADDWEKKWGRRKFDAKIFWKRRYRGVTIYLQQGGDGDVSTQDAYSFALKLERSGYDCWDGDPNTEMDMGRQLLYVHEEDLELGRGVRIGGRRVILIDPDSVCELGEHNTWTNRMARLADHEDRIERDPEEDWDGEASATSGRHRTNREDDFEEDDWHGEDSPRRGRRGRRRSSREAYFTADDLEEE